MKTIILINCIVELFFGICIILYPELLVLGAAFDTLSLNTAKLYGIAASAFGIASYIIFRYAENALVIKYFALLIITFHLLLGLQLFGIFQINLLNHFGPVALHLALAIVFLILYLRKSP